MMSKINYNLWSQDEINFLIKNYKIISLINIQKYLNNRSFSSIYRKARELNLHRPKKLKANPIKWNNKDLEILTNYYSKLHIDDLLKLLPNRTKESIYCKAKKLKLKSLQTILCDFDRDFFKIPNPINCYYAGLLASDGCVRKDKNEITLIQKDINVLKLFQKYIKHNGKISKRINQVGTKKFYCHSVSISDVRVVEDLKNNFNIVPNKSLILQPPNLLDDYLCLCFIIGLIDGDGCVSIYLSRSKKRKYIKINIIGTIWMLEWVKNKLKCGHIYHKKVFKEQTTTYNIVCNQAFEIINKLRSIKELKNIRFGRKWNKILELQNDRINQYNLPT